MVIKTSIKICWLKIILVQSINFVCSSAVENFKKVSTVLNLTIDLNSVYFISGGYLEKIFSTSATKTASRFSGDALGL